MANANNGTPVYQTWNDSKAAEVQSMVDNGYQIGKNLFTGTDNYGQTHWSHTETGLAHVIDNFNNQKSGYTSLDGTTTYNLISDGKGGYTTVNATKASYDANADEAKKNLQADYANVDAKAQTILDQSNATTNANYNSSATAYYNKYMQQQKQLKEKLSNMGATGGISETANAQVLNTYANNYATNEGNRNAALASNQATYNQTVLENSQKLADQLASISTANYTAKNDFDTEAQNQAYTRANTEQAQKNKLEEIAKSADAEVSTYKKEKQFDVSLAKSNTKSVNTANSNTIDKIKSLVKSGKSVWVWYTVDSNGNYVLHKSTSYASASAAAKTAGTSAYKWGSNGVGTQTSESIKEVKQTAAY